MNRANTNDGWVKSPDGSLGFTCSHITGCFRRCAYCFAMRVANGRTKNLYLKNDLIAPVIPDAAGKFDPAWREKALKDPFWPRIWPERLEPIFKRRKPVGIFMDIMGDWADEKLPMMWKDDMFDCIRKNPQHIFYLLSKCHEQIPFYVYPKNCRVGATATDIRMMKSSLIALRKTKAKQKFLSVEPMLGDMRYDGLTRDIKEAGIDMVIIGAATGRLDALMGTVKLESHGLTTMEYEGRLTLQPDVEWVTHLIIAALTAGSRVYLKNNLYPSFSKLGVMDTVQRPYWIQPGSDGYELRQDKWADI